MEKFIIWYAYKSKAAFKGGFKLYLTEAEIEAAKKRKAEIEARKAKLQQFVA